MGARPCDWQEASTGMWGPLPGWVRELLGGRRKPSTGLPHRCPLPASQPGLFPSCFVWGTQQPANLWTFLCHFYLPRRFFLSFEVLVA